MSGQVNCPSFSDCLSWLHNKNKSRRSVDLTEYRFAEGYSPCNTFKGIASKITELQDQNQAPITCSSCGASDSRNNRGNTPKSGTGTDEDTKKAILMQAIMMHHNGHDGEANDHAAKKDDT